MQPFHHITTTEEYIYLQYYMDWCFYFCLLCFSHLAKITQWEHPISGKRRKITGGKQQQQQQ